ncbi:MAG: ABC transporter permease [Bryobacteraceae bacterium]
MWQDIKLALRGFRRTPAFTIVAVASLALGIGANTAIFSFVNVILLKRLAVPEPERLVTFAETRGRETSGRTRTVEELAKRSSAFDGLFGWFAKPVNFSSGDAGQWVISELVTGQYFRTLKVKPAVGKLLTDDDVRNAAGNPVCVLSYALAARIRRRLGRGWPEGVPQWACLSCIGRDGTRISGSEVRAPCRCTDSRHANRRFHAGVWERRSIWVSSRRR